MTFSSKKLLSTLFLAAAGMITTTAHAYMPAPWDPAAIHTPDAAAVAKPEETWVQEETAEVSEEQWNCVQNQLPAGEKLVGIFPPAEVDDLEQSTIIVASQKKKQQKSYLGYVLDGERNGRYGVTVTANSDVLSLSHEKKPTRQTPKAISGMLQCLGLAE